jgi:hypothetical protein
LKSLFHAALLLAVGLFTSRQLIRAQEVDGFIGIGTAQASSNGQQIDTFNDGTLHPTPSLGGAFADYGFNVFFSRHVGFGWNGAWKFSSADYGGLQYRASFHAFDVIVEPAPIRTKRVSPEIRAGIGFVSAHFDFNDPANCAQVPGCPTSHFFVGHTAAAARLYFTNHIFVRPAVDVNYVYHFYLFGSHWVPRYSMSVGYSFGRE